MVASKEELKVEVVEEDVEVEEDADERECSVGCGFSAMQESATFVTNTVIRRLNLGTSDGSQSAPGLSRVRCVRSEIVMRLLKREWNRRMWLKERTTHTRSRLARQSSRIGGGGREGVWVAVVSNIGILEPVRLHFNWAESGPMAYADVLEDVPRDIDGCRLAAPAPAPTTPRCPCLRLPTDIFHGPQRLLTGEEAAEEAADVEADAADAQPEEVVVSPPECTRCATMSVASCQSFTSSSARVPAAR